MAAPETLIKLLSAAGPSGYEQAPAAVFREAAGAFAEVSSRHRRLLRGDACRARRREVGGDRRPHRRDRADRPPRRRRRLPVVHRHRRLGPGDPRRPARRGRHARRRHPGRGGQEADPPAARPRGAQEGARAQEPAHRHRRQGRRRRARAGAHRRLRGHRGRAGRAAQRPLVSRAMDNRLGCFAGLEAARLLAEAGGAPGDFFATAVAQEEITFARRAHDGVLAAPRRRDRRRRHVRHRRAGDRREGARPPPLRLRARSSTAARRWTRWSSSCCYEAAEAEGIPFTVSASARSTGTDADAVHISRAGIPTGVVSIPLRYMHSPVEMVQLDDIENTARLLAAFAQRLEPGHRLHALTAWPRSCCCSTSTARCCSGPRSEHAQAIVEAAEAVHGIGGAARLTRSRPRGGPTSRSPASCCSRPASRRANRRARGRGGRPRGRGLRGPVPRRPVGAASRPASPSCSPRSPSGPTSSALSLVTGNLRGRRAAEARAGRGRRTGSRRARAASAPTTAPAPSSRRSPARGCPTRRGRASARSSSATPRATSPAPAPTGVRVAAVATGPFAVEQLAEADAVADDARALLPVLEDWL